MSSRAFSDDAEVDQWLAGELRSDHAGETGAVWIYRGILAVTRDDNLRAFARRHLATERRHLALIETVLSNEHHSLLLPLWRVAGFLTGALPALAGPGAAFRTIEAVETFVETHYQQQIDRLTRPGDAELVRILTTCMLDEVRHKEEARERAPDTGALSALWTRLVGAGSAAAVALARRI